MNLMWTDIFAAFAGLFAGFAAGTLYFRGLWQTTKSALENHRPAAAMIVSFLVRAALLLVGFAAAFYLSIAAGLAMTLGFAFARHRAVAPHKRELTCS